MLTRVCTVDELVSKTQPQKLLCVAIAALLILSLSASNSCAWNIPGHMLSGAIPYQILQRESPAVIPTVRSVLEKNPWYESRWKAQLDKLPEAERDETLFMLAARWADEIRTLDKAESRLPWHYIDFPFKPEGEPANIQPRQPPKENILTAIAVNERILRSGNDLAKRGIALSWLFHLIANIHPPVHAVTLFSREYPNGDEGGTETCIRVAQGRAALSLHQFWDELLTSSNNTRTLRKMAIDLRTRAGLTELGTADPEIWAKEATK